MEYFDAGVLVTLVVTDGITPVTTSRRVQYVPSPASGAGPGEENILLDGDPVETLTGRRPSAGFERPGDLQRTAA